MLSGREQMQQEATGERRGLGGALYGAAGTLLSSESGAMHADKAAIAAGREVA